MIEFITTHPWSCTAAWTLAAFLFWSMLVVASNADDEAEKMGRIRRVK